MDPMEYRWNGDMEGRKGSTEEGGTRSPLLIKWPKGIKAGTKVMQIASVRDLLPTLTELAGVKGKSKKSIDGKSLKTLLSGNTKGWKSRTLVSTWKGKLGVRDQRFRLGYKGKLFDMKNDPGQRVDVSKQFPKVTERLNQRKQSFQNKVLDKAGQIRGPL